MINVINERITMKIYVRDLSTELVDQFIYKQFEPPVFVGFEEVEHSRWDYEHHKVCQPCKEDYFDAIDDMRHDQMIESYEAECDD